MNTDELNSSHKDALNTTAHWFGGSINSLDLFVASIDRSIIHDLVDMGLMRSRWVGWEITYKGRKVLSDLGYTSWRDTRRG